jgi:hypothetical protein
VLVRGRGLKDIILISEFDYLAFNSIQLRLYTASELVFGYMQILIPEEMNYSWVATRDIYVYIYSYMYMYMYTHICICIFIFI